MDSIEEGEFKGLVKPVTADRMAWIAERPIDSLNVSEARTSSKINPLEARPAMERLRKKRFIA